MATPTEGTRRRGRRPAGQDTRAAIVDAARTLFTSQGYDSVSLRAIAREAGVDPALVHHYFDGKAALFADAVIGAGFDPATKLAELDRVPPGERGRAIVATFLSIWDEEPRRSSFVALMRAAMSADEGLRPFQEFLGREVLPHFGGTADDPRGALRSQLVASQVLGMALARYVVRLPEVVDASPEVLVEMVGANLQRSLDEPLPASIYSSRDE